MTEQELTAIEGRCTPIDIPPPRRGDTEAAGGT